MKRVIAFLLLEILVFAISSEVIEYYMMYTIQNRIAGGEAAEFGQFPYQVGVRTFKPIWGSGQMTSWCGGSLISRNIVLTAAHCMKGIQAVQLFLGATDLSKEEPSRQIYYVSKEYILIHEEYIPANAINDIALISIPHEVKLNDNIQIINLPRQSQQRANFDNVLGWISGWGSLGDKKGSPKHLQYAQQWTLPSNFCELNFKNFRRRSQICLDGSNQISACRGDSGGPLAIIEKDGSKTLIGLTSYGKPGGCENGFPVVFTRITSFLNWISFKTGIIIRD